MSRVLSDDDVHAIAQRLNDFSGLTMEEHRMQHLAFSSWIARQERNARLVEKIKEQVGGWFIISLLGGIGFTAWHGFLWFLERNR